jgi:hypothetical protein
MSTAKPLAERIHAANTVAVERSSGAYPPPPPTGHQNLTEIAAEANGVTVAPRADHNWENKVFMSDVKPGSLTDRAIKANASKPTKPARIQ